MTPIVTGVSTGALIAPFAFLGPKYDPILLEAYTKQSQKSIFKRRNLVAGILGDALSDTTPLHQLAARYVELYGKMAQVAPSLEEALAIANRAVTKEDLICITGSFYLVGEAKKYFAAKQAAAEAAKALAAHED